LKDVATFDESGISGMGNRLWQGLFVPAGTPQGVIDKLNAALRETLADEKVMATYKKLGVEAFPAEELSPAAANALVSKEFKKWGAVIKDAKIQPEGK
jgi:tripartite-type tricarboxylate transporter receptor subunit TctC